MIVFDTIKQIAQEGAIVLGAVSTLSTLLAHLPLPAKAAEFFARIGVATSKFKVEKAAS